MELFGWMEGQDGYNTKDPYLYARLMSLFSKKPRDDAQVLVIFNRMRAAGVTPDNVCYNSAIGAAGTLLPKFMSLS